MKSYSINYQFQSLILTALVYIVCICRELLLLNQRLLLSWNIIIGCVVI